MKALNPRTCSIIVDSALALSHQQYEEAEKNFFQQWWYTRALGIISKSTRILYLHHHHHHHHHHRGQRAALSPQGLNRKHDNESVQPVTIVVSAKRCHSQCDVIKQYNLFPFSFFFFERSGVYCNIVPHILAAAK